ncbi:flagellar basal-body rod protein FlgG (plasmid) [Vibrio breoganii]|uniref:Flagellar basal-body rod protein FlgG n=1 Tax=Vibrio breoganii TaxID=553239 RepID=A0AAN0XYV8_9VIBR|nr:flagellar basal-body rod protein FlgG [Vibrio breoganii]ANO35292.1 flagellar basal-body rod protein FlgG [Vibrio breoganii]PML12786.1 flagellar basal-body rod protein FlgG [Vibrio breoganii]
MNTSLWVAKTGLEAQNVQMQTISNNLANVNTIGFKQDRVSFESLFYTIRKEAGAETNELNRHPTGVQLGSGVKVAGTSKVFTQGAMIQTNQELDIAVEGDGFIEIEVGDDTYFTRNGQLHVNSEGQIVNSSGYPLAANIFVPEDAVGLNISEDGVVSANIPGEAEPDELGQITIARFMNPQGLSAIGGNLYRETAASGEPNIVDPGTEGAGFIKQGMLEGSNVDVVDGMVQIIATSRGYETGVKAISAIDGMLQFITSRT